MELLAPAKNLQCGIAAVDHGADAVYIGAMRFGARSSAGNPIEDIAKLCQYAHPFGVKVYVTVNTLIDEDELDDTFHLMKELQAVGVDAFLVQDMGIVKGCGSRLTSPGRVLLHASTQTDNRTAEKVSWLRSQGFRRVVLARELSLKEIREIHEAVPDMELEVFVHGALCVSYSGQCYASEYCFGRSANRGECAQFCRMKFDLTDGEGHELVHQRHLLSLKDLCQIDRLEALADAGAMSFKIEGRLKDVEYVKNVVSAYNRQLQELIRRRPDDYQRASKGRVEYGFEPDLRKTFNRGYTHYFLNGRERDIWSPDTPKALGECVGRVKEIGHHSFSVAGTAVFSNGDGLCFFNDGHELEGFRVNKAEGNRLYPQQMPATLRQGMILYRNNDEAFKKLLSGKTAVRKILIKMVLRAVEGGFELQSGEACVHLESQHQPAQKPQRENIVRQLTKLGNTPYQCEQVVIENGADGYFIPSSHLAELKRKLVDELSANRRIEMNEEEPKTEKKVTVENMAPPRRFPYLLNVTNTLARDFYEECGVAIPSDSLPPTLSSYETPLLMQCRHCIRFLMGYCVKRGGRKPTWKEPLSLRLGDGRLFRLEFDCKQCQMNVFASDKGVRQQRQM